MKKFNAALAITVSSLLLFFVLAPFARAQSPVPNTADSVLATIFNSSANSINIEVNAGLGPYPAGLPVPNTADSVLATVFDPTTNRINVNCSGCGGSPNAIVDNPTSTQTITPGSSSVTGLIIQSNGGTSQDNFDVYQNGWQPIRVTAFGQVYLTHDPQVDSLGIDLNQTGTVLNFGANSDHITFQQSATGDISGIVSITASTSGSHSFASPYANAPYCVVSQQGLSASPTVYFGVGTTTSAITVYASTSGTYTVAYVCHGAPN